ncbi:MAG: hypothetical protein CMP91_07795 [Gammaproteobacteria bacterium]|nr:hypothetical protein [Gammaproteobacteria bacterium]|tara:strand:+ start:185768 stop:186352 length:585 start_codon:yes stop_codon:yes gene_type:complete
MTTLTKNDLLSLEEYSGRRQEFKAKVIAHKRPRQLSLTKNARLYFEDEMTIRYQIQEMLRIEKVFEAEGIQDELDAYNPLIPDGKNLKATFMLEYEDAELRKAELAKLIGVEDKVWLQVEGFDKVYAIADEDLDRENDEKTSSVHFVRFEFTDEMVAAFKEKQAVLAGCDHEHMRVEGLRLSAETAASLSEDFA